MVLNTLYLYHFQFGQLPRLHECKMELLFSSCEIMSSNETQTGGANVLKPVW